MNDGKHNSLKLPTNAPSFLIIKRADSISVEKLEGKTYSVGRSSSSDIVIFAKGISRRHATICFDNGSFWIIDGDLNGHASTNGIYINGQRVSVHRLKPYDTITFHRELHAFFLGQYHGLEASGPFEELLKKVVHFVRRKDFSPKKFNSHRSDEETDEGTTFFKEKCLFLDDLTQLPNRKAFFARVQRSLEFWQKMSGEYSFSVLFIDVDRFKLVNDSLGHLVGDEFLRSIARRIGNCLRGDDMVARIGGDEFAILLDAIGSTHEAVAIAKRLQKTLAKPMRIKEHELYPSISIGIAFSSLGYQTVEEIIRDADTAMYQAKATGRARFVIFDEKMHQRANQLFRLDSDLRKAIANQELKLYYQPIVSLKHKRLIGFEALLRWNHPEFGAVDPAVFIPIAEETELIRQIGHWVLNEACKQLSQWRANPKIDPLLTLNINVSAKQLHEVHLADTLLKTVEKFQLSPRDLKLEVTESILMESIEHSVKIFHQLKQNGFQLAIDDFGTGYSSLSYLSKFPIDALKIDRSFISQIDASGASTSVDVTNSIIGLAHSLKVKVVAEGIERLYHLAWLQQQRCDYGQGYLFSKPLTATQATSLAETGLDWKWKV